MFEFRYIYSLLANNCEERLEFSRDLNSKIDCTSRLFYLVASRLTYLLIKINFDYCAKQDKVEVSIRL